MIENYVLLMNFSKAENIPNIYLFEIILSEMFFIQICFKTGPLQCLRDVPQCLMYLTII